MNNRIKRYFLLFVLPSFFLLSSCNTLPGDSDTENDSTNGNAQVINTKHRMNSKVTTSSDNYARLGVAYLAQKNYEKAMLKLQKAIKLNNTNAKAYNYLGVLYWRLEKTKLAQQYFKKSQQLSPYNAAINHNYASFLCKQKQYKQASLLFKKVFDNPLYDKLSDAYQMSGSCDLAISQLDSAEKKYKKALQLDKNNVRAMLGMAKLYYKRDNVKIAQYYFDRFEQKSLHSPDSLWLGINIQRKLGDNNKLASYILELKNLYPDSNETLLFIEGKQTY
jgi:type IV pilus assembly protein PilF